RRVVVVRRVIVVLGEESSAVDARAARRRRGAVTLGAHTVAGDAQLGAVGIVAGGADDPRRGHAALTKGAPLEDLVLDLPVDFVELGGEDLREVGVEERGAVRFPEADRGAAAVTAGAELHLALLRGAVGEALGGIAERRSWGSIVFRGALVRSLGPGQVRRGGAVAALAADAQGVPRRVVGLRGIVAAAKAGRVAFDAHEVGFLLGAGPMEPVAVVHPSAVVEVDPAPRAHVPGGAVSLEATVRQAQEVLLEGIDAERVGDPILRQLSVRARRVDPEGAVTAEEAVTL